MSQKEVRLSFVTSCYSKSRLAFLEDLLHSIAHQSVQDTETIVVVDGPEALVHEVECLVSSISLSSPRVLRTATRMGASASRNLGGANAAGDIIGFVDDDVVLEEHWAANALKVFQHSGRVAALTGSAIPIWESAEDAWLPQALYWVISCTSWFRSNFVEVRNMWTMNSAIRKDVFLKAGGFDTKLGPRMGREAGYSSLAEDLELSLRLRSLDFQIFHVPSVACRHHVQGSQVRLSYIAARSLWIGRSRKMLARLGVNRDVERLALLSYFTVPLSGFRKERIQTLQQLAKASVSIPISLISIGVGYST